MLQPLEPSQNFDWSVRIHNNRIELSKKAVRQFAWYFPYPWVIWIVGAIVLWGIIIIAPLGVRSDFLSDIELLNSCNPSLVDSYDSTACANLVFVLQVLVALSIALIGVLFQMISLLRCFGSVRVDSLVTLFLLWGSFLVFVYLGSAFLVDIDSENWTSNINTVFDFIGNAAAIVLLYLFPVLLWILGAIAVSCVIWYSEWRSHQI
jgi:hypothetical protein